MNVGHRRRQTDRIERMSLPECFASESQNHGGESSPYVFRIFCISWEFWGRTGESKDLQKFLFGIWRKFDVWNSGKM